MKPTPSDRLREIELSKGVSASNEYWLIARVKQLEEASQKAIAEAVHCDGFITGTRILKAALECDPTETKEGEK